jgi:hypothetical protein
MPIAEPADALWGAVKGQVPWPDTNEDSVRTLAGSWESAAGAFDQAAGTNTADLTTSWIDTAGVAMFTRAHQVLTQAGDNGQAMRQVAARVTNFAGEVTAAKQSIVDLIAKNSATYENLGKLPAGASDAYRAQFASQVASLAQGILDDAAGRVAEGAGAPLAAPDHGPAPAAPGGGPAAVKAWWDGLSDADRAKVMQDAPDSVRNLDGVPATVRDSLNRAALDREIDTANAALKADQNQGYNPYTGGGGGVPDGGDSGLRDRVNGMTALRDRLNGGGPPTFLLELDTAADGKGVVATGNPDTAANVTTYVPGTMADLNSITGDVHRADVMYDAAQAAGSPSTSVITWVGYDAPDELYNAGSESYADGGKADLQTFQDGLRATHIGPVSHNTVLGHSYGTTTIGHAARDGGLNADDLVFVASPGVGVDQAGQLHLDGVDQAHVAEHVHSTTAVNDMIHITNGEVNPGPYQPGGPLTSDHDIALGPDPADPAFDGDVFASAPGTPGPTGRLSPAAHSEYWDPGNPALTTIGDIIAGRRS